MNLLRSVFATLAIQCVGSFWQMACWRDLKRVASRDMLNPHALNSMNAAPARIERGENANPGSPHGKCYAALGCGGFVFAICIRYRVPAFGAGAGGVAGEAATETIASSFSRQIGFRVVIAYLPKTVGQLL